MNHTVTFNTYKSALALDQHKSFCGVIRVEDFNTYECKHKYYYLSEIENFNRKNNGGK